MEITKILEQDLFKLEKATSKFISSMRRYNTNPTKVQVGYMSMGDVAVHLYRKGLRLSGSFGMVDFQRMFMCRLAFQNVVKYRKTAPFSRLINRF